jgi:hypothetical protein
MKTSRAEELDTPLSFRPKTPLGRRLWEIRQRIVASGVPLLDEKGIEREIRERRGGYLPEDAGDED